MTSLAKSLFAICAVAPASASGALPQGELPPNTLDCAQFGKAGDVWSEVGTASFGLGGAKLVQQCS